MGNIKLNNYYTKDDKILLANIIDKYEIYLKTGKSTCSNFLNPYQFNLVSNYLKNHNIYFSKINDYDFLEKNIIYFGKNKDFVTYYKVNISNNITHSNILGTLFSLGLKEDTIGDIIVEDGYFYYTNLTRLNHFLEENLVTIKNELIKLNKVEAIILKKEHFKSNTIMISSMRADNILSKITNKSRSQVINLLKEQMVLLNFTELKNPSVILKENDILSIRKIGKFKLGKTQGYTKKNNIILEVKKYI